MNVHNKKDISLTQNFICKKTLRHQVQCERITEFCVEVFKAFNKQAGCADISVYQTGRRHTILGEYGIFSCNIFTRLNSTVVYVCVRFICELRLVFRLFCLFKRKKQKIVKKE